MEIIDRARWGARYPDGFRNAPLPAREVWLHHSVAGHPDTAADERDEMRDLERIGQDRFGGGISYTFVVAPSGRVYEGHSVHRQGAHTGGRNDISRAICLMGNYEHAHMTDAQVEAIAALLRHGAAEGWWTIPRLTGGHRDLKATACPGRHAYARIDDINRLATAGGGASIGGEDDMPYSEQDLTLYAYRGTVTAWQDAAYHPESHSARAVRAAITPILAPVRGEVAGLGEAVRQLASGHDIDLDAIREAARQGAQQGTAEGLAEGLADGAIEGHLDVRFERGEQG